MLSSDFECSRLETFPVSCKTVSKINNLRVNVFQPKLIFENHSQNIIQNNMGAVIFNLVWLTLLNTVQTNIAFYKLLVIYYRKLAKIGWRGWTVIKLNIRYTECNRLRLNGINMWIQLKIIKTWKWITYIKVEQDNTSWSAFWSPPSNYHCLSTLRIFILFMIISIYRKLRISGQ